MTVVSPSSKGGESTLTSFNERLASSSVTELKRLEKSVELTENRIGGNAGGGMRPNASSSSSCRGELLSFGGGTGAESRFPSAEPRGTITTSPSVSIPASDDVLEIAGVGSVSVARRGLGEGDLPLLLSSRSVSPFGRLFIRGGKASRCCPRWRLGLALMSGVGGVVPEWARLGAELELGG